MGAEQNPATEGARQQHATQEIEAWFAARGWRSFPFQREVQHHWREGRSGLLHASTGAGKTMAVFLAALQGALAEKVAAPSQASSSRPGEPEAPLHVLWVTPLRALAADTERALREAVAFFGLPWTVERRTSDTSSATRNRQRHRLPSVLITTPESLSLLLTHQRTRAQMASLSTVVVDEWHELLGSRRGVQLQLALARLRRWCPELRVWGLSATLGNLEHAVEVLHPGVAPVAVVAADVRKKPVVDALFAEPIDRFPWFGHIGLTLLEQVVAELEGVRSALVFTNTRNQAERWYQEILAMRPEWAGTIALHHGSLDRGVRDFVEAGLGSGQLRCVICTSSLDLGVDFQPVERVFQIGSARGIARLLQRAGRSGHRPGETSRVTCVPAHALEYVEIEAALRKIGEGVLEGRMAPEQPFDVLAQHLITIGLGGGFEARDLFDEVRSTWSYRALSWADFVEVLDFCVAGGEALRRYEVLHRLERIDGRYCVIDEGVARRHRVSIGTITADPEIGVVYQNGAKLGTVEERFVASLRPGERFLFSGRSLEVIRLRADDVVVRRAKGNAGLVAPKWAGGSLPLSAELAEGVREVLEDASAGNFGSPLLAHVRPVLELQRSLSYLPRRSELLVEELRSREGTHLFVYPFAGRRLHEGLASLVAWRLSQQDARTFSITTNEYGFELLSDRPFFVEWPVLLEPDGLLDDLHQSANASELARRSFREIARTAGLVFQGFPGARRRERNLQMNSGLWFDVLQEHASDHVLVRQAWRDVLDEHFRFEQVATLLAELGQRRIVQRHVAGPTPLAFPLLSARIRSRMSSESFEERVRRMVRDLEARAG